jgi:serine protease Do
MESCLHMRGSSDRRTSRSMRSGFLGAMLAVALVVALPIGVSHAKASPDSFADLAERLLPSVVNISTTQTMKVNKQGRGPEMPQFPPGSPFEEFFKDFLERNQGGGNGNGGGRPAPRRAQSLGSWT